MCGWCIARALLVALVYSPLHCLPGCVDWGWMFHVSCWVAASRIDGPIMNSWRDLECRLGCRQCTNRASVMHHLCKSKKECQHRAAAVGGSDLQHGGRAWSTSAELIHQSWNPSPSPSTFGSLALDDAQPRLFSTPSTPHALRQSRGCPPCFSGRGGGRDVRKFCCHLRCDKIAVIAH